LKPYVGSKSDEINTAFDEALEALGNPGLFGVGQKPAELDVFKKKVNYIYGVVKPLFPYKAYVKPAATAKPAATPKPAATTKPAATQKPAATPKPAVTAKPAAAQETAKPTDTAESETPSATPSADVETVQPSAEAGATAAAAATATPAPAESETTEAAEQNAAAASTDSSVVEESGKELAAHAPMEHADKTNPLVTVSVIGGVVLLGGAGVWLARKKKWF
ncbi:MAG TPA: hypothetical protein VL921_20035, partial [Candidatus Udaeobacter sp.]|nr:hypothetical protein [Candidatus Udaeobacter sp.]